MRYLVSLFLFTIAIVFIGCSNIKLPPSGACNDVTQLMDRNLESSLRQKVDKPIGTVTCDDFQEIDTFEGFNIIIIPKDSLSTAKTNQNRLTTNNLVKQSLDSIKEELASNNIPFASFGLTPAIGVDITKIGGDTQNYGLIDLIKNKQVGLLVQDVPIASQLTESLELIGAPSAWQSNPAYEGQGMTVVVVDTGVDGTHSLLKDKLVAEACFSTNDLIDGSKNICPERNKGNEKYFGEGQAIPCKVKGCEHGTMVASIATGVAPKANIIAIQVFSSFEGARGGKICSTLGMDTPCVLSYLSDQLAALEFIEEITSGRSSEFNLNPAKLVAVNMSLGGGVFLDVDCTNDPRIHLVNILRERNIPTIVAAGNSGQSGKISAPACIPGTISVASVDDGSSSNGKQTTPDTVSPHSNIASFVSLAAPGKYITAAVPGGGFATGVGTSFAAPHVSGAWALLKQKYPDDTIGETLIRLKRDGRLVARDNIELSRIDLGNIFNETQKIVVTNIADSGEGSLRQAIAQAESRATIVFDKEVFKESQTIVFSSPINILFKHLTIQGPGRNKLSLDGARASSIFFIAPNISVSLSDMTFTKGLGGAISNSGNLLLKRINFIANISDSSGGAINNDGNVGISEVIFQNNKASSAGAIHNTGIMIISNSSFKANTAKVFAGAIMSDTLGAKGSLWISHSTFESNRAFGSVGIGGAIVINKGIVTIKSSFFGNNQAAFGGALMVMNSAKKQNDVLIENTTIAGNKADIAGGLGVYDFAKVTLHHTTIAHNTALYAGGVHISFMSEAIGKRIDSQQLTSLELPGTGKQEGKIRLESSLIVDNSSTKGRYDIEANSSEHVIKVGYNCLDSVPNSFFAEEECINKPILLKPAMDNGGLTKTIALEPNNLAVNKINNCRVAVDQRGNLRPLGDDDKMCDVGAFEL